MDKDLARDHPPVRALLFDLGNVVIDLDFAKAFEFWADRAGRDPEELAQRFSMDELYEQHERGDISASLYFAGLRRTLGVALTDKELIAGWNDIYVGPTDGMSELLDVARRHLPLFAFTNSNPTHQAVWQDLYAEQLLPFRAIFVSSELRARKPDTHAFLLVARRMGFEPGEVLFFDDGAVNVEGARKAGMQGVLVHSTGDVRRALTDVGLALGS